MGVGGGGCWCIISSSGPQPNIIMTTMGYVSVLALLYKSYVVYLCKKTNKNPLSHKQDLTQAHSEQFINNLKVFQMDVTVLKLPRQSGSWVSSSLNLTMPLSVEHVILLLMIYNGCRFQFWYVGTRDVKMQEITSKKYNFFWGRTPRPPATVKCPVFFFLDSRPGLVLWLYYIR